MALSVSGFDSTVALAESLSSFVPSSEFDSSLLDESHVLFTFVVLVKSYRLHQTTLCIGTAIHAPLNLLSDRVFGSEAVNEQSSGFLGVGLGLGGGVIGVLALGALALVILARRRKEQDPPPIAEIATEDGSSWTDEDRELMSNENILAADEHVETLAVLEFHGDE
jgi:hypothetical protein